MPVTFVDPAKDALSDTFLSEGIAGSMLVEGIVYGKKGVYDAQAMAGLPVGVQIVGGASSLLGPFTTAADCALQIFSPVRGGEGAQDDARGRRRTWPARVRARRVFEAGSEVRLRLFLLDL